jgi:hypothetical protein
MRSFIFNSDSGQHERTVPQQPWKKVVILLAVLVIPAVFCWEMYWRGQGYQPDYDSTSSLWSEWRQKAENGDNETIVIFGSSRAVFDIDLHTWWEMKGDNKVIQCAIEGTGPLPIFEDFVQNTDFAGTIVLSVAPDLVFTKHPEFSGFDDSWAQSKIDYYYKWNPAQKMEHALQLAIEPHFAYIEQGWLDLRALLTRIPFTDRADRMCPPYDPAFFSHYTRYREAKMWDRLLTDTAYAANIQRTWIGFGTLDAPRMTASAYQSGIQKMLKGEYRPLHPVIETWRPTELDSFFVRINDDVQKFKQRGGKMIFIRPPSSGGFRPMEAHYLPRELYWDRLLRETGCPGVHFEDYPELQGFELPEWSHMRADQTPAFTRALVKIINEKLE